MFVAKWEHGLPLELMATNWIDATQEALKVSAEDPFRDNLISIEWQER